MEDNLLKYNLDSIVSEYEQEDFLYPAEAKTFNKFTEQLARATLLDIGIGAGRTTMHLQKKCKKYIGIDYSEKFVIKAKEKFPEAEIKLMDARDLSDFSDHNFDWVVFSFNGIDYVSLNDRNKILQEIRRVLKPNGVFFFSTHNKAHKTFNKMPWLGNDNSMLTNFKIFVKLLPYYWRHLINKSKEEHANNYSIINDCAHNFGLLTFYTTPLFLREQLNQNGFCSEQFLLKDGEEGANSELDEWIYVICKTSPA